MADLNTTVPMSKVTEQITMNVKVTGVRRALWRLWLGVHLIKLAALVIGCNITVEK